MKIKHSTLSILLTTAIILLSACGSAPAATPTIRPEDVHNTAIAAAFTVIAETHVAQPTETNVPPTETPTEPPAFTDTPIPSPTLESTPTSTPTTQSDTSCDKLLGSSDDNRHIQLEVRNKTRFDISATVFLNTTSFGECGYRAFNIPQGGSVYISDLPYGCYNFSSYIYDPNGVKASYGYGCANNPDLWWAEVLIDKITFNSP